MDSGQRDSRYSEKKKNKKAAQPPNTGNPEGSQPFGRGWTRGGGASLICSKASAATLCGRINASNGQADDRGGYSPWLDRLLF